MEEQKALTKSQVSESISLLMATQRHDDLKDSTLVMVDQKNDEEKQEKKEGEPQQEGEIANQEEVQSD